MHFWALQPHCTLNKPFNFTHIMVAAIKMNKLRRPFPQPTTVLSGAIIYILWHFMAIYLTSLKSKSYRFGVNCKVAGHPLESAEWGSRPVHQSASHHHHHHSRVCLMTVWCEYVCGVLHWNRNRNFRQICIVNFFIGNFSCAMHGCAEQSRK